jgi:hypothetical protein
MKLRRWGTRTKPSMAPTSLESKPKSSLQPTGPCTTCLSPPSSLCPPRSLCSNHIGLPAAPPTCPALSCPRAFAQAVPLPGMPSSTLVLPLAGSFTSHFSLEACPGPCWQSGDIPYLFSQHPWRADIWPYDSGSGLSPPLCFRLHEGAAQSVSPGHCCSAVFSIGLGRQ